LQQVSFVNHVATRKSGTHVSMVIDDICGKLMKIVKTKKGKEWTYVNKEILTNNMWIFVNSFIENPKFDSQTKECLVSKKDTFGSKCEVSDVFIKKVAKSGLFDRVLEYIRMKNGAALDKQLKATDGSKTRGISGIPKLEDAHLAGTSKSDQCTLILTEVTCCLLPCYVTRHIDN
jgi:DNA topoisomerase-2